jgi:transcriptional regulator with XRE-family HTH domain
VPRKYKTLSDYFEQTGDSQQALANKIGVTRSAVCQWAAGKRQPSLHLALRIETLTGVPAESLISREVA